MGDTNWADAASFVGVLIAGRALVVGRARIVGTGANGGAMTPLQLVLPWLVAINVATAAAYGYDKLAAPRGGRRMRERTLWILCLAGGVGGAWRRAVPGGPPLPGA